MPARPWTWLERMVAGGYATWALGRLTAADRVRLPGMRTVAWLSFTPQVAGGAWLTALLLRDRRAAATTTAAAALLTALVAPRALGRPQPEATGPVLRVLTVNLLVGRAAAEPLVELVRRTGTDVLFVQELTGEAVSRLSAAGLGRVLPYAVTDLAAPGSRGNGIYGRYPLTGWAPATSAGPAQPVVTMSLPGGAVRLACVHLHTPVSAGPNPGPSTWRAELRALPPPAAPGKPPLVVAGDFNGTLDHAEFRSLLRRGYADAASESGMGLVPTWGPNAAASRRRGLRIWHWWALVTIDHVLADRRCAVLRTSVHALPGTDHRAVFAELALAAGPAPERA